MKFTWLRRKQLDTDLNAEIRQHLDEAIRDRIARGESPEEARANAFSRVAFRCLPATGCGECE